MKNKRRRTNDAIRETRSAYRVRRKLTATEASRNFSEVINRIRYRGESFLVERGGESVCEIRPAVQPRFTLADLVELINDLPAIDEDYLRTVEELMKSQPSIPASPWQP